MAGLDAPPLTEMEILGSDELFRLTAPVTQILLDAGFNPNAAGFVAVRAVRAVLERIPEAQLCTTDILYYSIRDVSGSARP